MKSDQREIERKFLIRRMPRGYRRLSSTAIEQGYLVQDEGREIRLRRAGQDCFLTIKEGEGLMRREVETPITRRQFKALWPLTEGRRLSKTRFFLPWGRLKIEIDRYAGPLRSLCVAEVEFSSPEEGEAFAKPPFLGDEITTRAEYRNAWLAGHGLPHRRKREFRIGTLPYLYRNGRLHLVLITNSDRTRWLIPKGQTEPDMTRQDVGLIEAFEEAGVIGKFLPGRRIQCTLKDKTVLHLYPLRVSTLLGSWPESSRRERLVLPLKKALRTISDRNLAQSIQRVAAKLL